MIALMEMSRKKLREEYDCTDTTQGVFKVYAFFLAHLCICTVGSYASLSVRPMSLDQNPKTRK